MESVPAPFVFFMKQRSSWILLCIFTIGVLLRFYRLGDVPVGFHRDEAFLGYNAYALYKTGHDISGQPWPLHFSSFLFSPAGYSYAAIPAITLFNLSVFAVRLPSAIFGAMTVLVFFFMVRALYREHEQRTIIALVSSLLFAISPWHVNLSRTATENVMVVFFIVLGVFLYLTWLRKPRFIVLFCSFISFAGTLLLYQAPRAFLPFFIPLLLLTWKRKKALPVTASLFILTILLPLLFILSSRELSLRLRTVSIVSTQETQLTIDEQIREDGTRGIAPLFSRGFHNKFTAYSFTFLKNYFAHFTFDFFFTDKGFPDRYRIPGMGLLYLVELPLILMGFMSLFRHKNPEKIFIFGWILLSFIGSALTFDDIPNLQRTLIALPALSIVSAHGIIGVVDRMKSKGQKRYKNAGIMLAFSANILFYLHQYYIHQLVHRPWYRHEGYKELVTKVNALLPRYTKAIITDRESAPTIFFLFFGRYDPARFREDILVASDQSIDRRNFASYEFTQEECPVREETITDPVSEKQTKLFVGEPEILYVIFGTCKIPIGARLIDVVKRSDGTTVFQIASVSPTP